MNVHLFIGAALAAALALPARAHRGEPARWARVQVGDDGSIEAMVRLALPAGDATRALVEPSAGMFATDARAKTEEERLGLRGAAEALRGIAFSVGEEPRFEAPELVEARGARTESGGVLVKLLVRGPRVREGGTLRLRAGAGVPAIVALVAASRWRLELVSGRAWPAKSGFTLRLRPGSDAAVTLRAVESSAAAQAAPKK